MMAARPHRLPSNVRPCVRYAHRLAWLSLCGVNSACQLSSPVTCTHTDPSARASSDDTVLARYVQVNNLLSKKLEVKARHHKASLVAPTMMTIQSFPADDKLGRCACLPNRMQFHSGDRVHSAEYTVQSIQCRVYSAEYTVQRIQCRAHVYQALTL